MKELKKLWPWRQLRGEKSCINWWAKLPCLLFSFVCTVKPKIIHTPGKFGVFVSVHFIYLFIFIQVAYKCDRG